MELFVITVVIGAVVMCLAVVALIAYADV